MAHSERGATNNYFTANQLADFCASNAWHGTARLGYFKNVRHARTTRAFLIAHSIDSFKLAFMGPTAFQDLLVRHSTGTIDVKSALARYHVLHKKVGPQFSWDHVVEAVRPEMYPIMAIKMEQAVAIKEFDIFDLSEDGVDKMIDALNNTKGIHAKEVTYIKGVIQRLIMRRFRMAMDASSGTSIKVVHRF